jgi:hypothetical protein
LTVAMKYLCGESECGEYLLHGNDETDRSELQRLGHDVLEHAIPFYTRVGQVSAALRLIDSGEVRELQKTDVFVPVTLLEQGRPAEAVAIAQSHLATKDSSRGNGKQCAEFVERLSGVLRPFADNR